MRRNFAHLSVVEQQAYVNAVRQIDLLTYGDGVSYWDKQDQIHSATHNHRGNSFIPWHRELCNRYEKLLQAADPEVALHYWDWTQDPRAADNGSGGTSNLCTDELMGTANGLVAGPLASLHNNGEFVGSRDATRNYADPPRDIWRNCLRGAPRVTSDAEIFRNADFITDEEADADEEDGVEAGDPRLQEKQWTKFREEVEGSHDIAHGFFGPGSNISDPHNAFQDPFVYLLHSNVDRLFAMWQTVPGQDWRLDQNLVYGEESTKDDDKGILHPLQPWDGTVEHGAPIPPWDGSSPGEIVVKNCRHPSVVKPPCYDTLPLTVEQVAPTTDEPIRFLDVYAGAQTARAFRLRVRGCRQVTCNGVVSGDAAFSLLASSVVSPEPTGFETHDVLVWVLFDPGAVGSTPVGTLDIDVPETGNHFTIPIHANVIEKPTVAASLVLDRSGSMDLPSGVAALKRIEVLRNAAPLFVHLLDEADGIGVVRFDTDAVEAEPVRVAGGQIAGAGRTAALSAITTHATNPSGLTAIGDGLVTAAAQLATVSGSFDHSATVVFTDGHETAENYIADVIDFVNGRVFAIGLGTADQLNPGTLSDLVDGTGGYLLLTGNAGPDDQILLQKYFAQVLAGVTNAQIVVDPEGFVPVGGEARVPFSLVAGDRQVDVIALSPAAGALTVHLEAPDGSMIDSSNGVNAVLTENYQTHRVSLPSPAMPGATSGQWIAHLKVDRSRLDQWLKKQRKTNRHITDPNVHGVPFTLTVQVRSSVRMSATITQTSHLPGQPAEISVTLAEAGIPLANLATVRARITNPAGAESSVLLTEVDAGLFRGSISMVQPGTYRLLIQGHGTTRRSERFTREELRTANVWNRGDDRTRPQPRDRQPRTEWGDFLICLLDERSVGRFANEHGLDLKRLRECVKRHVK